MRNFARYIDPDVLEDFNYFLICWLPGPILSAGVATIFSTSVSPLPKHLVIFVSYITTLEKSELTPTLLTF